ncbi:MAG: hypothetical protein SGJ20_19860 [Planctomycetota bacterium]|nr:hypothetical protein [Planctomycetota bacterium]
MITRLNILHRSDFAHRLQRVLPWPVLVLTVATLLSAGCGAPAETNEADNTVVTPSPPVAKSLVVRPPPVAAGKTESGNTTADGTSNGATSNEPERSTDSDSAETAPLAPRPVVEFRPLDRRAAEAMGIRILSGKHLELWTDVPSKPEVDELPQMFDQAFPQWCRYLGIDSSKHDDWRVRGFLIEDKELFRTAGLLPRDLPRFINGFARPPELWLYNQSSDYYRRHLLLHEGVHSVMFMLQNSNGPPWYMEGIAELLATHRLKNGQLQVGVLPQNATEVPKLGRIEIIQTDFARQLGRSLAEVLAYDNRAHLQNEAYGWSWGAVAFLDGHPRYQNRFRKLVQQSASGEFNAVLLKLYQGDQQQIALDWLDFVASIDHGYDFRRTWIEYQAGKPLTPERKRAIVQVAADRGWQGSGVQLKQGERYRIAARGEYQIANTTKPWISEPNGVTIRYHNGRPLGLLMGAIIPDESNGGATTAATEQIAVANDDIGTFMKPLEIGLNTTFVAPRTGTLYLRINDSAGELKDNVGNAEVAIVRMAE